MTTVPLALRARLARVTALRDVIDASGGGQLRLYASELPETPDIAPSGTPLGSIPLATPSSGSVSAVGGLATLTIAPATALVAQSGLVSFARLTDGEGNGIVDLRVGLSGSEMPVILSALQLWQGGAVDLLSCVIEE